MRVRANLAQQGQHRRTFIHQMTDVSFWRGQREGALQDSKRFCTLALSHECHGLQDEDLQGAAHTRLEFGVGKETIQQAMRLLEKWTCWILPPLCDTHSRQG